MENSSEAGSLGLVSRTATASSAARVTIPEYLSKYYWWAYLHPKALKIFERKWLIDAILWGNYNRLSNLALVELGEKVQGRVLQMACVYGSLTSKIVDRLDEDARLDVIDVADIQLENLAKKVVSSNLHLDRQDASHLEFDNDSFDQVLLFFLLHELPLDYRKRALSEAIRVIKPGGKLIIVDYHRPEWRNPLKYVMPIVFKFLEPFAIDLWKTEISNWMPDNCCKDGVRKRTYFGGLYQHLVMLKK